MGNVVKTTLLLTALTFLFLICGKMLGGNAGLRFAFIFACIMNFGAYWFSDKIVLSMYRAQKMTEADDPELFEMIHDIATVNNLPVPEVYFIPSAAPNAFATGRNPQNAAIAVTQGILDLLDYYELKAVLAHEMSHIEHRDILISSITAVVAGAIGMLAWSTRWSLILGGGRGGGRGGNPLVLLLMTFLIPIAATIIQLAISRSREFHADERGAELCENPLYLASALKKLEAGTKKLPMQDIPPSTAHLFIVNPLLGQGFARLFSTHPPLEARIGRLEQMAREQGI